MLVPTEDIKNYLFYELVLPSPLETPLSQAQEEQMESMT